mmetsp:Transcript_141366/g.368092  ORF Transcript_141366/g.368092 Transcript_141366/m.368092 type:complete len:807 (+) Transcript_141366:57-2477(+)
MDATKPEFHRGWSGVSSIVQATCREFPPVHAALAYSVGDSVEVWSNSRNCWLSGIVMSVFVTATVADGYSVQAGTVKVQSDAGVKWVFPEHVSTQLQKTSKPSSSGARGGGYPSPSAAAAAGASESPASGGSSSSTAPLCKNGCGRPVQPGLARGLRPYDTCCKRCAQHPGADKHDENCGLLRRLAVTPFKGATGKPEEGTHRTCKRLLDFMLSDTAKLGEYVRGVFGSVAKGADRLDRSQVKKGLQTLFGLFGIEQDIADSYLVGMCSKYGGGADIRLGVDQFSQLCQAVLEDRRAVWFPEILPVFTRNFVKKNEQALQEVYELGRELGKGTFGTVYGVKHKISGEVRVCKSIAKSKSGMDYKQILQEIGNMALLDHPNVIKVYEYLEDDKSVSQIMEQCKGGELQAKVDEVRRTGRPSFDEAFLCDVIKQTLRALAFMHNIKILHKDLKPQNIMLVESATSCIKVIDFGLAEMFDPSQEFATSAGGTLLYMAPEVFKREMTTKVDVWSAGVILYNLVTGDFPFMEKWPPREGKDQAWWQEQTIEKIKTKELAKNERFSPHCWDLVCRMFRRDPEQRPDASQCLEHPWFQKFSEVPPTLSVGVVQCVEAYARMSELKKAIFLLIAHQCAMDTIPELRALFTHFDYRNRGTLSTYDLHQVLVQSGMGPLRAERVLHTLDRDCDGQITWTEFTAAAICVSVCRNARCVDAAFASVDLDQDGYISAEDLIKVLTGTTAESQRAWQRRMPELFEEMVKAKMGSGSHLTESVSRLTKMFSKEEKVSRHQFRAFVGQKLDFRAGDALYAVT